MVEKTQDMIAEKYRDRGLQRTDGELIREQNSSFLLWFKEQLRTYPPPKIAKDGKLKSALAHGPACNLATYKAYDINGYTFYTEAKDKNSDYQNSGVKMESLTGDIKER